MPTRTARNDFAPARFSPSNSIFPEVGLSEPAIRLRSVVLPAPFGPISPTSPPCSISKLTSFTAASPAKYRVTFFSLRMGANGTPRVKGAHKFFKQAQHASRFEQNNQD